MLLLLHEPITSPRYYFISNHTSVPAVLLKVNCNRLFITTKSRVGLDFVAALQNCNDPLLFLWLRNELAQ